MKHKLLVIGLVILLLSFGIVSAGLFDWLFGEGEAAIDNNNVPIQIINSSIQKWHIIEQTGDEKNYDVIFEDAYKQDTKIIFKPKEITAGTKPDKDITFDKTTTTKTVYDKTKEEYSIVIPKDVTEIKFGSSSIVTVYDYIKMVNYQNAGFEINNTLYINISNNWDNTVDNIFAFYDETKAKYGANVSGFDTDMYFKYHKIANKEIINLEGNIFGSVINKTCSGMMCQITYHKINLTDICEKPDFDAQCIVTQPTPNELVVEFYGPYDNVTSIIEVDPQITIDATTSYNSIDSDIIQHGGFATLNITDEAPWGNLSAWYTFDEQLPANSTVNDWGPYNLHGTKNLVPGQVNGVVGQAMTSYMDGSGYSLPADNRLQYGNFTIAFWMKPNEFVNYRYPIGTNNGYMRYGGGADILMRIFNGSGAGTQYTFINGMTVDVWNHITLVFNTTGASMRVDGYKAGNADAGIQRDDGHTLYRFHYLGNDPGDGAFNGSIDEVIMIASYSTPQQVKMIYNKTAPLHKNYGEMLFNNTNVSSDGTENRLNITLQGYQNYLQSNISVKLDGVIMGNISADGTIKNLTIAGDPEHLNITFGFHAGNYSYYSPMLLGNITIDTWTEGGVPCVPDIQNSTFFFNTTIGCMSNDTRNDSYYYTTFDAQACGFTAFNTTEYFYNATCDFCTPSLVNTTKTAYINLSCASNQRNQSRNWTQYDQNNCGEISNLTFFEYQLVGPNYINTTFTDWINITCLTDNTMNQSRSRTQYDTWVCAGNTTFTEYQNIEPCVLANNRYIHYFNFTDNETGLNPDTFCWWEYGNELACLNETGSSSNTSNVELDNGSIVRAYNTTWITSHQNYNTTNQIITAVNTTGYLINWSDFIPSPENIDNGSIVRTYNTSWITENQLTNSSADIWNVANNGTFLYQNDQKYNDTAYIDLQAQYRISNDTYIQDNWLKLDRDDTVTGNIRFTPSINITSIGKWLHDGSFFIAGNLTVTDRDAMLINNSLCIYDISGECQINLSVTGTLGTVYASGGFNVPDQKGIATVGSRLSFGIPVQSNIWEMRGDAAKSYLYAYANDAYLGWERPDANNQNIYLYKNNTAGLTKFISMIGSTEYIGIGTDVPSTKLFINSTSGAGVPVATIQSLTAGGELLYLRGETGTSVFEFGSTGTGGEAQMNMLMDGVVKNVIDADGDSYFNGGKVGIGVPAPNENLHVNGTLKVQSAAGLSSYLMGNVLYFDRNAANYIWTNRSGGYLLIGTNGRSVSNPNANIIAWADQTTSMMGNISIRKVEADYTLDINSTNQANGLHLYSEDGTQDINFRIGYNTSTYGFYWKYSGAGSGNDNELELWSENQLGSDLQVYEVEQDGQMTFNQNVGIGTTNPVAALMVSDSSSQFQLHDSDVTTNDYNRGGTQFSSNNGLFTIQGINSSGIGGTYRFVLNQSTGSIGLGTTQPTNKLEVTGTMNATTIEAESSLCLGNSCISDWEQLNSTFNIGNVSNTTFLIGGTIYTDAAHRYVAVSPYTTLSAYTILPNTFQTAGNQLVITAHGTSANAIATSTSMQCYINNTAIFTPGIFGASAQPADWELRITLSSNSSNNIDSSAFFVYTTSTNSIPDVMSVSGINNTGALFLNCSASNGGNAGAYIKQKSFKVEYKP